MKPKGIKLWEENAVPKHRIQWCPGCGDFGVLAALKQALVELEIMPHELVLVGGIGCSGNIRNYLNGNAFHGTHGGPLAYALGMKMANPDLKVICLAGDGDTFAIGVENFVHTCRRDPDMVLLVMNNGVYGLTKGQDSPTAGLGQTVEVWSEEHPPMVDPVLLALASEATFVAQSFSGDVKHTARMIVEAFQHPGFAFINDFSPCVTYNKFNTYEWFREHVEYVPEDHDPSDKDAAWRLVRDFARRGKLPLGVIYRNPRPRTEARRLPVWEEELRDVDVEPILATFR
ncbi:MAG: thiamine pyrophosphate-dependent enzyme [Armatimonadetes bacterium]|nr:thiamine pyrophosphate-dependent enzyme [Armatimonadota bacterium]MDW8153947.1 thiamine pyrophosphate-dependent enzyme [Armatimonadota bacterium]